jgi:hypothetical protein
MTSPPRSAPSAREPRGRCADDAVCDVAGDDAVRDAMALEACAAAAIKLMTLAAVEERAWLTRRRSGGDARRDALGGA